MVRKEESWGERAKWAMLRVCMTGEDEVVEVSQLVASSLGVDKLDTHFRTLPTPCRPLDMQYRALQACYDAPKDEQGNELAARLLLHLGCNYWEHACNRSREYSVAR